MLAHVNAEMVAQIVESVFTTMMNLEVFPSEVPWVPSGDQLTAAVQLSGAWNGAVLFECDARQACQFAGLFLSMDPPDGVNDDVRDVLAELANMIGGNLKCALSMGLSLSLPWVSAGNDYRLLAGDGEIEDRLAFQCEFGAFWVTLLVIEPGKSKGNGAPSGLL